MSSSEWSSLETDDEWQEEEWESLVGKENVAPLVEWLAELCPSNILLHTYSLEDEPRDRAGRYERDEAQLWEQLGNKFPDMRARFEEKKEEYEEEFGESILSDFFLQYRKPWMVVGNEEAREALKTLEDQSEVYNIARVHRLVFTANPNMTEFTSHVLNEPNPSPFLVLDALEDYLKQSESSSASYTDFGFNMGCARDLLRHLVAQMEQR